MYLEKGVVIWTTFPTSCRFYKFLLFPSKSSRAGWDHGVLSVRYVPFHTEAVLKGLLRTTKKKYMRMRMYVQLRDYIGCNR